MITKGRMLPASAFPAKKLVRERVSHSWLSFLGVGQFSPQNVLQFARSASPVHFYLVSMYNWNEILS